ncbi:hypothetical protein NHQ30_004935 [Ciborinia camelliae]|nr:hypothetical protein NHQ30_004935 [Ciborinia camelliae]
MSATSVEIEAPTQEHYLLSRRDEEEKDRLDQQSNIIGIVRDGHVLDPSIPKQNIYRIADVATGTGIWLREVAAELVDGGYSSPLKTVGFDISAKQFPKTSPPENKFVVWDMTTSFPQEYHRSFDVVHVRLVILALKVEQIKDVVQNIVELLKPGGYLQWTDFSYMMEREIIFPVGDGDLSCKTEGEIIVKFIDEQGYSYDPTGDVEKVLQCLPLEGVHVTNHTGASRRRPEIRGLVAEWYSRTLSLILEMILLRNGQSEQDAKMVADVYRKKVLEMEKRGMIFEAPIMTMVARRKRERISRASDMELNSHH